jgi:Flp pilus assembly pilin Flp
MVGTLLVLVSVVVITTTPKKAVGVDAPIKTALSTRPAPTETERV